MIKILKKLLKNRTVTNASWLIVGKIAQMVISLIVGLLSARYLGPSNYGLINYGTAYTTFFASFCTLGINSVIVKEFIDNPGEEGKIIGTSLGLRAISSFLSAVIIFGIVSVFDAGETDTIIVVLLCSIGMIFHIFEIFNYWFQSQLKSKVTAIVAFIAYGVMALYKVVLMICGKSVGYFAFATALDYIVVGVLLLFAYRKHNGGKFKFSSGYAKEILHKSCHFILPGLMVAIYGQTDKVMLKQMMGDAEIGYYSTALYICTVWCFVLSAIIDSVYPSIMEANRTSEELFNKRNKQLYAIVFYVSVSVSLLITVFGKYAILILYGEAYLPATLPLSIITWYTAFSYLGVARNAWIVCKDRQKYLIYVYAAAAASNVILNMIFIPLWGAAGAAVASLLAQVLTSIVIPFFIKGLKENSIMMLEAIFLKGIK